MSVNFIRKNHFFLTQNQLNALILFRCTIFHFPFIVVDSWIGLVLRTPFPLEQFSLRTMACEMSQAPKTNSHTLLLFSPLYKWIGLCYLFPIECAMNSWNTCCSHNTILCGVWNNVAKKQTSLRRKSLPYWVISNSAYSIEIGFLLYCFKLIQLAQFSIAIVLHAEKKTKSAQERKPQCQPRYSREQKKSVHFSFNFIPSLIGLKLYF